VTAQGGRTKIAALLGKRQALCGKSQRSRLGVGDPALAVDGGGWSGDSRAAGFLAAISGCALVALAVGEWLRGVRGPGTEGSFGVRWSQVYRVESCFGEAHRMDARGGGSGDLQ